ncbi:hypothetical protein SLEP1_g12790 [Rubroshorea leprosula]|uniref:PORR domain-containing protein n=1 Tax=Rubroshorea leprosula TaxID=152421 RepID=A0AAV5INZ3_9ROSI|nr:hypothetical protein SLEP1_g12790 [Rubroshorea leprosula]
MGIRVRSLEEYREQINLPKPHMVSDFIRKSTKLFELYKDRRGVLLGAMAKETEALLEEKEILIEEHSSRAAEYVTRLLMMSVDFRRGLSCLRMLMPGNLKPGH